jgi:hypothetical protein
MEKSMIRGILGAFVLTLSLASIAAAQTDSAHATDKGFSVLGILSIPTGDYADDEEGLATLGGGVGVEYQVPMSPGQPVNLAFGGYFIHNPMDFDALRDYGLSAEGGGYNHAVALGGLHIKRLLNVPDLYVQGLIGVDLVMIGDVDLESEDGSTTQKFSPATSLAFSIGLGHRIGKWDIGVRYMNFGEPKIESVIKDEFGDTVDDGDFKQKLSMVAVTLGYNF